MNKKPEGSRMKTLFEDYGSLILLLTLPVSLTLCLIQYFIHSQSMLLLIIALLVSGPFLLWTGLRALAYKELRDFTTVGASLLGAVFLVWAGFLILKPESQVSIKSKMIFETRSKAVSSKDLEISLDISPTTYQPGDRGLIRIEINNKSQYELVLDSMMFETNKKFFEGFIVDYESAVPPISERKEKLGISIALFFGEQQIQIPPEETADFQIGIVANIPGDYTGDYYAIPLVGLNSKAMPRKIPDVNERIFLVILSEE